MNEVYKTFEMNCAVNCMKVAVAQKYQREKMTDHLQYFFRSDELKVVTPHRQRGYIEVVQHVLIVHVPTLETHFACKLLNRFKEFNIFFIVWIPELSGIFKVRTYAS